VALVSVASSAPESLVEPTVRRSRLWIAVAVAYLASNVIFAIGARVVGYDYLDPEAHNRFDSGHYLGIAEQGYWLRPCRPDEPYPPGSWCGNTGWFPLYPALIRLLHTLGGSYSLVGWLVAEAATLGLLAVLAWTFAGMASPRTGLALLAVAATLPAGIYFHAIFPMSLTAGLTAVSVAMVHSRRWLLSGFFAALAATAYPLGAVAAVVALGAIAALLWRRELRPVAAIRAVLASCGPVVAGLGLVFAVMQWSVQRWDAYLLAQDKYVASGNNPVKNLYTYIVGQPPVRTPDPPVELLPRLDRVVDAEMLACLLLVALIAVAGLIALRAGRLSHVDAGLVVFAAAMFIAPLVVGAHVSQYRGHTLLLPALVVLRHLPNWLLWTLATMAAPLAFAMSTLFFPSLLF
jgi:hypothetical protein